MKKLPLILISIFLFLGSFYFVFFFIPQPIVIEHSQNSSINLSSSSYGLENHQKEPFYLKTISDVKNDFISENKSFLEINLSAMKIKLYQDGKATKEWPILLKGDPQGWGGSALGLYKIMSGNELSFSIVSNVYMPYALHYYGKYYIHGEPYYPGGTKRVTIVTGGCIQLLDKYAKEIYELTELNMPVLVTDKERDDYQYSNKELSDLPEISAESYLVADLDSGFVFAEKNSEEKLPITYLTELMTALLISENVDLRKSVLVKPEMLEAYGSTRGLEAGKSFRVVELFYPLLIESSNDAAEVLSYFLGRDKTIEMMNEKAKAILMDKTEFIDPQGFDIKNVSTAQDLFQLARYLLNARPPLLEITKGKEVKSFGEVRFDIKEMWNKNIFINDPNFIGGKTGFLPISKSNALFVFKFLEDEAKASSSLTRAITKGGKEIYLFDSSAKASSVNDAKNRNIVIILLGSGNSKNDTQNIYRWLLENYSLSPTLET